MRRSARRDLEHPVHLGDHEHHGLTLDAAAEQQESTAVTCLAPVTVVDCHAETLTEVTVDVAAVLGACSS